MSTTTHPGGAAQRAWRVLRAACYAAGGLAATLVVATVVLLAVMGHPEGLAAVVAGAAIPGLLWGVSQLLHGPKPRRVAGSLGQLLRRSWTWLGAFVLLGVGVALAYGHSNVVSLPVVAVGGFLLVLSATRQIVAIIALRTPEIRKARALAKIAKKAYETDAGARLLVDRLLVLDKDHPGTLTTWHDIAAVLAAKGTQAEAEAEYRQVLAAQRRVLGEDHPATLTTWHDMAAVLAAEGRQAEAEAEYRQVLAAQRRVLGANHPETLATADSLERLQHD